jgi:hypothetical protein
MELLFKELKGVVDMGQQQVTKDVGRGERSVALSIMAYLLLLRLKAREIPADRPWSAFALQRALTWDEARNTLWPRLCRSGGEVREGTPRQKPRHIYSAAQETLGEWLET